MTDKIDWTKPLELVQRYSGGDISYEVRYVEKTACDNHIVRYKSAQVVKAREPVWYTIVVDESGRMIERAANGETSRVKNVAKDHIIVYKYTEDSWVTFRDLKTGIQLFSKDEAELISRISFSAGRYRIVKI